MYLAAVSLLLVHRVHIPNSWTIAIPGILPVP